MKLHPLIISALIILTLITQGCGTYRPHTKQEGIELVLVAVGQAFDGASTLYAKDKGLEEFNPLYGDSDERLIAGKIVAVALAYVLGQIDPDHRSAWYRLFAIGGFAAGTYNVINAERKGN